MEPENKPIETESNRESEESLVEKGWGIITLNTAILIFMLFGVVGTVAEVAGYWPAMSLQNLLPEPNQGEVPSELKKAIYKINDGVNMILLYSVHIYLATYILLPYPLLTERQKILLVPWLLCGVLRSILLNLLLTLAGVVLCSSHHKVHYPCLRYSALKGVEFCTSLFLWTSVHSFYHVLERKKSSKSLEKVLKTIHKASIRKARLSPEASPDSWSQMSVDSLYEDFDDGNGNEAALVERAAMAWIAREILEDDGEYVSDSQFSRYLVLKATMELRQIVKEMAEKNKERKRNSHGRATMAERIRESLEFARKSSLRSPPDEENMRIKLQAFDQSAALSSRDPLRKIPPLAQEVKPLIDDDDSIDLDSDVLSLMEPWKSSSLCESVTSVATQPNATTTPKDEGSTEESPVLERTIEVQTDPLSPQMNQLFDALDQCTKQRRKSGGR